MHDDNRLGGDDSGAVFSSKSGCLPKIILGIVVLAVVLYLFL